LKPGSYGNWTSQNRREREEPYRKITTGINEDTSFNNIRKSMLSSSADASEYIESFLHQSKNRSELTKSYEQSDGYLENDLFRKKSKPIAIAGASATSNRSHFVTSPKSYQEIAFNKPFSFAGATNIKHRPSSTKGNVSKHVYGGNSSVNPFYPPKNSVFANSQILRWEHVYPRLQSPIGNEADVKWVSLCTPACLPLTTEYFPNPQELTQLYQEYTYTVSPNDEGLSQHESQKIEDLISELIFQRLSQGFQIILTEHHESHMKQSSNMAGVYAIQKYGGGDKAPSLIEGKYTRQRISTLKSSTSTKSHSPYHYLGMGDQIHRLTYDASGQNVEVKRYVKRITYKSSPINYTFLVWRKHNLCYENRTLSFHYPKSSMYNWNYVDHLVAGYQDEMTDSLKFWRTRFLLIPLWNSTFGNAGRALKNFLNPTGENLDEEELWIAGFRRYMEAVQKSRLVTPQESEPPLQGGKVLPTHTLDVIYTTLNPTSHVVSELDSFNSAFEHDFDMTSRSGSTSRKGGLSSSTLTTPTQSELLTKDVSPQTIVLAMEHPVNGVSFRNRRWHLRLYENVCIGHELIDWLVRYFADINTRDEASDFGNVLLERGVIQHARKRHRFMDGYYFYRIGKDYEKDRSLTASTKGDDAEKKRSGWFIRTISSMTVSQNSSENETKMKSRNTFPFQKIQMTKAIPLDLDPHSRSDRKEVAILHYDTLHNPRNCYHFHLHWLVCTSQLIENLLQSWTRMAEKCGFRLVEAEVEQAGLNSDDNPFQSPVPIKMVLRPPDIIPKSQNSQSETVVETGPLFPNESSETVKTLEMIVPSNYFQIELLKHFGFLLDVEADDSFPPESVQYSFRKTPYNYTQYVHHSGVAFVQICDHSDYDFLWVNNRLFTSHHFGSNARHGSSYHQLQMQHKDTGSGNTSSGGPPNPDLLCKEFEEFCHDSTKLKSFWKSSCYSLNTAAGMSAVFDIWPDPLVVTTREGGTMPPQSGKCTPVGVEISQMVDMLNLDWNRLEPEDGVENHKNSRASQEDTLESALLDVPEVPSED
jgi:hypothetical protein